MYKNLYVFFKYLKFYYNYYNLILLRSERLFQNNFFKNEINVSRSFNVNFLLETHWSFLNRKVSYDLGFSSLFFTFKTNDFFFNFLSNHFSFEKKDNIISNFFISSSDRKNSRKLWKYKFVSCVINLSDWSLFFKNNVKKTKMLFLFGASHPLQSINFQNLKYYELDTYNKNEIDFNVEVSENNIMNQSKVMLLSELFFFNNSCDLDLDIDNKVFSFFFFKIFSKSNFFGSNKKLFKYPVVFSFFFFINYPYYFDNDSFLLESSSNANVSTNFFFDKGCLDGVHNLSSINFIFLKFMSVGLIKSNNTIFLNYHNFLISMSLLLFYGASKKKEKHHFKKFVEKKPNKKVVKL